MKFMHQLGLGFALGSFFLLSGTLTVQAQVRTDNTGPINTDTNGIDPNNTDSNGFTSDAVARVVNRATAEVNKELARGELKVGGLEVPNRIQQDLQMILQGGKIPPTVINRLIDNIGKPEGGPGVDGAEQLVNTLKGVITNNEPNGVRLLEVRNAYNEAIKNSSAPYLSNLPLEMKVINSLLSTIFNEANGATPPASP